MSGINLYQLSENEIYNWKMQRWKARTDLTYLARDILGYKDVIGPQRFPFINKLQKFPVPNNYEFYHNDVVKGGRWSYKPIVPLYDLPGGRRVLILDPRGFLKTTINAQSHTIQWILNYPDIAMMIIQSNSEKAEAILGEIKRHFQANTKFRALFPEHCPTKRIFDWGTKAAFTTEGRGVDIARKEDTLMTGSIDKGSAGYHFDVMKFSDIVEPNNVKTPDQIRSVIESFGMFENLLVRPDSWIDVEGTRYDFSDLYGELIKAEQTRKKNGKNSRWSIHVRGCYKKETPTGDPETFTPDELDFPYKIEKGEKLSWWPERWPTNLLEERRTDPTIGEYIFACQQLNNPVDVGDEQIAFPVNKDYPKWISRKNFRMNVRVVHYTTTVDTAETTNERSNLSAITTVAWDQYNRAYVVDVRAGKWLPDQLIQQLFSVYLLYKPSTVLLEETSFVRGLKPSIERIQQTRNLWLPLNFIKRETTISKKERIKNTLQPWYKGGDLRFLDDLDHKEDLIEELRRFPRYSQDDIIDSLADHFQGKTWFGREQSRQQVNPWSDMPQDERLKILQDHWTKILDIDTYDPDKHGHVGVGPPVSIPLPGGGRTPRTGIL